MAEITDRNLVCGNCPNGNKGKYRNGAVSAKTATSLTVHGAISNLNTATAVILYFSVIAIRTVKAAAVFRTSAVGAVRVFADRAVGVFSLVGLAVRAMQCTLNGRFRHTSDMAELWRN